eukprot:CAMPEP_0174913092 /NCGR_PEP_ID=MMETSP0167-20121228/80131_1 /TAXON_ID=38298 /ORGANISM="Rhodella maculata, Strain CCMP736" /LENGTH=532 /DNA_ID=CAMNT_0016157785 /DNA_START=312 /DNA_END=1914 /DNA_ORIENTATION=+
MSNALPIAPQPVTENGVSFRLIGDPYCGCDQQIEFKRVQGVGSHDYVEYHLDSGDPYCGCDQQIEFKRVQGVGSHDYVEYHLDSQMKRWEWCKKFPMGLINFGVHGREALVSVLYFRDGGTFSRGTMVASMKYSLRNPVESLELPCTVDVGASWNITCKMRVAISSCRLIIRLSGVRIFSRTITTLESSFLLNGTVRLPGEYEVAIVACVDGNTVLNKKLLRVTDYAAGGLELPCTVDVGASWSIFCKMRVAIPSCVLIIRLSGIRIFSRTITTLESSFLLNGTVRLPGEYEVAIVACVDGNPVLNKKMLRVTDNGRRCDVRLRCEAFDSTTRIFTTMADKKMTFVAVGDILQAGDKFLVVKVDKSENLLVKPSHASLQVAQESYDLGNTGKVDILFRNEGVYHVIVGLPQENESALGVGEWLTVIVSSRAGVSGAAAVPAPTMSLPPTPSQTATTSTAAGDMPTAAANQLLTQSSEHLCVICHDTTVNMLLEPCHHVCFCENCETEMRVRSQYFCPFCRAQITNARKIYLC